jgi:hypothetical protein
MPLWNAKRTSLELGIKEKTLYEKPFLARLGLTPIKIGRSVRFHSDDVQRVIEACRQPLPLMPSDDDDAA